MNDKPYVITQVGPNGNDDKTPEEEFVTDMGEFVEDVSEKVEQAFKGAKKFRDGLIFKVGMVVIAVKGLSVLGQMFTEIEKTKRMAMEREKERSEQG